MICPACSGELRLTKSTTTKRYACLSCRSQIVPERRTFIYDESYSENRGHHFSQIKAAKKRSYESHLVSAGLQSLAGKKILEFGFGSGVFLSLAKDLGANTFGIEVSSNLLQQAVPLGVPESNLAENIGHFVKHNHTFDTLFYFDSFEHILDPHEHLKHLEQVTRAGTTALVILPRADSISRYLMRSFWPHDVSDHWLFYSKAGLIRQWRTHGWSVQKIFKPNKNISIEMIIRHCGFEPRGTFLNLLRILPPFWFNFGEIGVVFEKD